MQNNIITSDGETRSPSAPAEHQAMLPVSAEPPANGQSAKAYREFSGLTKRRYYYSMPNIAVVYGAESSRSEKEYGEFFGLTKRRYYCSMPNIALMYGADDAIQLQSPSSVSTRPVSVGPAERGVASSDDLTGPPRKSCCSMTNVCVTFSAIETTGLECSPVRASAEDLSELKIPADVQTSSDSITSREAEIELKATSTQRGRRTWWKRTKKFVCRLFCCVPIQG